MQHFPTHHHSCNHLRVTTGDDSEPERVAHRESGDRRFSLPALTTSNKHGRALVAYLQCRSTSGWRYVAKDWLWRFPIPTGDLQQSSRAFRANPESAVGSHSQTPCRYGPDVQTLRPRCRCVRFCVEWALFILPGMGPQHHPFDRGELAANSRTCVPLFVRCILPHHTAVRYVTSPGDAMRAKTTKGMPRRLSTRAPAPDKFSLSLRCSLARLLISDGRVFSSTSLLPVRVPGTVWSFYLRCSKITNP